jgi:hypothetical protein
MYEANGMTNEERRLRQIVKEKKENIISKQGEIEFFEKVIKRLHQARCQHVPQSGDDGANEYCGICGKPL